MPGEGCAEHSQSCRSRATKRSILTHRQAHDLGADVADGHEDSIGDAQREIRPPLKVARVDAQEGRHGRFSSPGRSGDGSERGRIAILDAC